NYDSTGILTCCPSTTPFGLALEGFSPSIVTHAGILTSKNSTNPYGLTSMLLLRSPTASWQQKNIN
ncbi:11326_t:CDS:2, partial [Ambispora gerdemannii]